MGVLSIAVLLERLSTPDFTRLQKSTFRPTKTYHPSTFPKVYVERKYLCQLKKTDMPIESTNNIVFDFLTEPRFRIGRHVLLILMLIGYSVGQSMYVFDNHTGKLGWVSYVYTASLAVVYIVLTYIIIYFLAPHFLARNKFLSFSVVLLGSILFLVVAKNMIEYNLSLYLGTAYPINGATLLNYITEIIHTTICVSRNKKCDCNLLNNRFLKKKSITIGNDIEMSELLWSAVFSHRFK